MENSTNNPFLKEVYCSIKHDGLTEKQFNELLKMKEEEASDDYVISSKILKQEEYGFSFFDFNLNKLL